MSLNCAHRPRIRPGIANNQYVESIIIRFSLRHVCPLEATAKPAVFNGGTRSTASYCEILAFPPVAAGSSCRRLSFSQEQNREAWNERARRGLAHTEVAGQAQFSDPWKYIDDCGWLGRDVRGKRVLCLAAGGGWHGPLFASVGATVTVVDISPEMLARDKAVGGEHRLPMRLLEASMDNLAGL